MTDMDSSGSQMGPEIIGGEPSVKTRSRVVVFVTEASEATDLGVFEFATLPTVGDNITLPNQPLLTVNWRKIGPRDGEVDALLGTSYFLLNNSQHPAPILSESEAVNRYMKENKEMIIDIQTRAYDKGTAYTNVVIVAGYAAAFTIWSNIKQHFSGGQNGLIAILLFVSFSSFIIFEISKMILTAWGMRKQSLAAERDHNSQDYLSVVVAAEKEAQLYALRFIKFWPLSLILSIIPAIAAAMFLAWNFIRLMFAGI